MLSATNSTHPAPQDPSRTNCRSGLPHAERIWEAVCCAYIWRVRWQHRYCSGRSMLYP